MEPLKSNRVCRLSVKSTEVGELITEACRSVISFKRECTQINGTRVLRIYGADKQTITLETNKQFSGNTYAKENQMNLKKGYPAI